MKRPRTKAPKPGDLRVWNIVNPPAEPTWYPVKNPAHAQRLIDALADSQLLQPEIGSNAFGLEIFTPEGWEEWYNDEGEDIRDAVVHDPDAPVPPDLHPAEEN